MQIYETKRKELKFNDYIQLSDKDKDNSDIQCLHKELVTTVDTMKILDFFKITQNDMHSYIYEIRRRVGFDSLKLKPTLNCLNPKTNENA